MKKIIRKISIILLIGLVILIFIQSGSYNKLLNGKIEYKTRFFDSYFIPTKIGHYQIQKKKYNIKFVHGDPFASGLYCPYALINEEQISFCNFKAMELVDDEYFIFYYAFQETNSAIIYDLDFNILGKVNYQEDYTGKQAIELYESGEFEEIEESLLNYYNKNR